MSKLETDHICPRCGAKVKRIHRDFMDRVKSRLLQVRTRGRFQYSRYECSQCAWTGLRERRVYK
jgi:hypothetical protein